MAAVSPGDRIDKKSQSEIQIQPLTDTHLIQSLTSLCDLFKTSYGPQGHAKLIHNNCGGHVTLTTHCDRLLQTLSVNRQACRIIISSVKDHLKKYSDGGCFACILALELIVKALNIPIHPRLIIECNDLLLHECITFLQSDDCPCKIKLEFDSDKLLKLVKSVYTSKPVCLLFDTDLEKMCHLTLLAYVKSHSDISTAESVQGPALVYVSIEGKPPQESELYEGILYDAPQIPTYRKKPLTIRSSQGSIAVALIETSMAGDSDTYLSDVKYELSADISLSAAIEDSLLVFAKGVTTAGIGFLACQRVVHPKVKKILRQDGVLVVDRLGRQQFSTLHRLAGGLILNPFDTQTPVQVTSYLGSVKHIVLNNKSYIHMKGVPDMLHMKGVPAQTVRACPVYTLLLCHRTSQALAETKSVCEAVQDVLEHTAKQQEVLCGGTCWQTCVANHIKRHMSGLLDQWTLLLSCSRTQLQSVLDMFLSVLESTALTCHRSTSVHVSDTETGHHFVLSDSSDPQGRNTCQCGAVSCTDITTMKYEHLGQSRCYSHQPKTPEDTERCVKHVKCHTDLTKCNILDGFLSSIGSLKTAVSAANMVLGIHNYVQDNN